MRILVVTTEPVPFPGFATTGAGLRAWGLMQGLRNRGFDVEVAMAADAVRGVLGPERERVAPFVFERHALTDHVRRRRPDILVMQHWGLMNRLENVDIPIAIDLHGPHLLERRYWGSSAPDGDLKEKIDALSRADFLTCAGEYQRHYFLSYAILAGFDPTAPALLGVIPFSVDPELPRDGERDPELFIHSGMFLPWQDPARALETAIDLFDRCNKGRLLFIGGAHPAQDVSCGQFDGLLARLGSSSRVWMEPLRPSAEFERDLLRCTAAIDIMARNPERELAFTSRTVVYLAAGLPVLYNDYSELSHWISKYEAGWCLNPADIEGIEQTVKMVLQNPTEAKRRGENARRLVREQLTWDRTIEPLAAWCAQPVRRCDKAQPPLVRHCSRLEVDLQKARTQLGEMTGRRLVRLSNWMRRLGLHRGT